MEDKIKKAYLLGAQNQMRRIIGDPTVLNSSIRDKLLPPDPLVLALAKSICTSLFLSMWVPYPYCFSLLDSSSSSSSASPPCTQAAIQRPFPAPQ